jgi:prepilin signal peptidase PulO-like enzyme (type II secretory pathway)
MDADLSGSTKTGMFAKAYPERFFNMGIAEQNMYASAAGLALSGKTVCASTFAMFAAGRAFEIIRNSIGFGDMKLFLVMGLLLGTRGIWGAVFLSLIVIFFISVFALITKRKSRKDLIPFGPALVIGTYLAVYLTGM